MASKRRTTKTLRAARAKPTEPDLALDAPSPRRRSSKKSLPARSTPERRRRTSRTRLDATARATPAKAKGPASSRSNPIVEVLAADPSKDKRRER